MPDEVNRRKAPLREILDIVRRGSWGQVTYDHRLACGHTEQRSRATTTTHIKCTLCFIAEEKRQDLRQLSAQPTREVIMDVADLIDSDNEDFIREEEANFIRAGLAVNLDIPIESIDLVLEDGDNGLELSFAMVYLSAQDAHRLSRRNRS
ncbi:MAG: hypothetical protein ACO4AZ_01600 [Ilumatobacteraceae bacterium]